MAKKKIKKINKEYRKTAVTGITAAFGFITALAWRDVINESLNKTALGAVQSSLISALILTFFSVVAISLASKLLPKEK